MMLHYYYLSDSILACGHQLLHAVSIYFAVFFLNHLPEEVIRKTNEFKPIGNEAVCYNATRVDEVLAVGGVGYGVTLFTEIFGFSLAVVYTIMPIFNLARYRFGHKDWYFPRFASLHYAYIMGKQPREYAYALYTYLFLQWGVALFGLNSCTIFPGEYKCLTGDAKWFLALQMIVATLGFLSTVREPVLWRVRENKLKEASNDIIFDKGFFCLPKSVLFLILQNPRDRIEHIENSLLMLRSGNPELAAHELTFSSGNVDSMYECITFDIQQKSTKADVIPAVADESQVEIEQDP